MCCLSAMVMLGADWCQCADTVKETHLTTCCLEMSLSMPKFVNIDHTHPNTKYVACAFMGGSPSVHLVIMGTN